MTTSETQAILDTKQGKFSYFSLKDLGVLGISVPESLPFSIKILLESALRNCDGFNVTLDDVRKIVNWDPQNLERQEIAFMPGRVILQDFTGVPCIVDLAAMRSAIKRLGGDIAKINPQVRCDLVIDHSLQVDMAGTPSAMAQNMANEFQRNQERYEFLKWGQNAFQNFSVIPPGVGIIHQLNLEYLSGGLLKTEQDGKTVVYPDSLVGTDSHTTMINGLGVVGWGVGGIEAEAVMLGEPISMLLPEVVGFRLTGKLQGSTTPTDVVLTVVEILRKKGVVGKFVEFFGDGIKHLTLPDRAMISNMAPEYGATIGLFPVDQTVLDYYIMTGRDPKDIEVFEEYMKTQGMFYSDETPDSQYSDIVELDLSTVEPCVAGPKRPQDRIVISAFKQRFESSLVEPESKTGFGLDPKAVDHLSELPSGEILKHGSVVIAAITSCTNTSNPSVLMAAGLVAKKAVEKELTIPEYVKTSFTPGSRVTEDYLTSAGLLTFLEDLRFHIAGYGCATCIGNSGPLSEDVSKAIQDNELIAASVLSGNRNFEGRVHPLTKANYLASPPLVVAYALAGTVNIDFAEEPIGQDPSGKNVYLKDIWPTADEVNALVKEFVTAEAFRKRYANILKGHDLWDRICVGTGDLYQWKDASTYIQEPPFFQGMTKTPENISPIKQARVLVKVGDSVTTDHISPAGFISPSSPAGTYLQELGVKPVDFNSYGSRRGNDKVMARGTFANIRLRNQLAPGTEGSWTTHFPSQERMTIFDAAVRYQNNKVPLVILAGKEYGTGSSRDWAAKGPALLGVKIVIAESYERIHRSNLVGMGILPLQYQEGDSAENLGLTGNEVFNFKGIDDTLKPGDQIFVTATDDAGKKIEFVVRGRMDTPVELAYYRNGGILQTVIRKLL